MAIISFEEIEQQVVEQESPVDTVADKELLEESVNLKQKELMDKISMSMKGK